MSVFRSKQARAGLSAFPVLLLMTSLAYAESTVHRPAQTDATEADPLIVLVDEAISRTRRRFLDANQHTPWQILHGLLAVRQEFELDQNGRRVNAIEYLSNQARFRGDYWFEATPFGGRAHPFTIPYAFEGHVNQSLALLSMSGLPEEHEFRVRGGQVITMADMVRHAQMTVNTNEETTWTLWFLTNYLDQDTEWINQHGEPWSMERLVRLQVQAEVTTRPCGGTHQLFALAFARNACLDQQGRLGGAWIEADQKLRRYTASARSLQNSDGSFSTAYFKGREFSYEFNKRITSSGHTLEWLMMAIPDRDLDETWIRRGVESVSRDLINNAHQPADCGPLYHSLHSLVLYRARVTPEPSPQLRLELAETEPADSGDEPEARVTIEDNDASSTQTVARPPDGLPVLSWSADDDSENEPETSEPNLPPPPPTSLESVEVVSAPDSASEEQATDALEEDQPPLPPRRTLRSAETGSGNVTR